MRVDVLSSIPWLVLVIVPASFKVWFIHNHYCDWWFSWMSIARMLRAETLKAKVADYVVTYPYRFKETIDCLATHPASHLTTLIVTASTSISSAIMTESALSFLGMGIQQPLASWVVFTKCSVYLTECSAYGDLTGLFILLTIYSFNIIGDLIRDCLEKRVLMSKHLVEISNLTIINQK